VASDPDLSTVAVRLRQPSEAAVTAGVQVKSSFGPHSSGIDSVIPKSGD
jgi:hypothetical protein